MDTTVIFKIAMTHLKQLLYLSDFVVSFLMFQEPLLSEKNLSHQISSDRTPMSNWKIKVAPLSAGAKKYFEIYKSFFWDLKESTTIGKRRRQVGSPFGTYVKDNLSLSWQSKSGAWTKVSFVAFQTSPWFFPCFIYHHYEQFSFCIFRATNPGMMSVTSKICKKIIWNLCFILFKCN